MVVAVEVQVEVDEEGRFMTFHDLGLFFFFFSLSLGGAFISFYCFALRP